MAYSPFDPQPGNRGGVPYREDDDDQTEGDGDMPAGDYMGHSPTPRSRPHIDPQESLEAWRNELSAMNEVLQEQHTDLEREIKMATYRKIRCEGQIEMVLVSMHQIEDQLKTFAEHEKRTQGIKIAY